MSVGRQFKRIGEIGVALALWRGVFWIFAKPKRIFLFGIGCLVIIGFFINLIDNTNKKHYVNINELTLLDKPFGDPVKVLNMNDSLILLREMGDKWIMVLVENDTLYFNDSRENYFLSVNKIETTPFTIEKALKGEIVKLNHPDGYFDAKPRMLRNGDEISIIDYSTEKNEIKFKIETSSFLYLPLDFVILDWENLKARYPRVNFEMY